MFGHNGRVVICRVDFIVTYLTRLRLDLGTQRLVSQVVGF